MSERVNHHAGRHVTRALGAIAALAVLAGPAQAASPPGTPTGSTVEIIFLDAAGQPKPAAERPAPAAAKAEPAEPKPSAPRAPAAPGASAVTPGAGTAARSAPAASAASTGHPAQPIRTTTEGSWGASRRHPILGDGSNAAELVAAAQRVVGLRGRADRPIVAHVFASAGVPLRLADDVATNDAASRALAAAGREIAGAGAAELAFGDVVFFSRPPDVTVRFGVVEGVDSEGRVHVIGESGDVVSRFVLTDRQHAVRAVARP